MAQRNPLLYHVPASCPSLCVVLTAKALDIPLDIKIINMRNSEHKTPEYLKMNPQHTIPTLDDNGFYIWDSHAIGIYLIEKYGPKNCPLYPECPKKRGLINQKLHFDSGILFQRTRALFEPIFYNDDKIIKLANVGRAYEAYDFLEAFLAESDWLVGDALTVADIYCATTVTCLEVMVPLRRESHPKTCAWVDKCKALPVFKEVNKPGIEGFTRRYQDAAKRN